MGAKARRILVIDDNVDAAESLQVLLAVFGHTVEIAHDDVTALPIARAFKPDLVFLDIGLPGMNGYEVAHRLREEIALKSVKLIALSGYGTETDRMRSASAGFHKHLVKPVDPARYRTSSQRYFQHKFSSNTPGPPQVSVVGVERNASVINKPQLPTSGVTFSSQRIAR